MLDAIRIGFQRLESEASSYAHSRRQLIRNVIASMSALFTTEKWPETCIGFRQLGNFGVAKLETHMGVLHKRWCHKACLNS